MLLWTRNRPSHKAPRLDPEIYAGVDSPGRTPFEDEYVCIARAENSRIDKRLDLETLSALPHVVVEFERQRPQSVFQVAQERVAKRLSRAITVSSYSVVPFLIVGTERIGLIHARHAAMYAGFPPLPILKLPVDIPKIVEVIQWQKVDDTDEGLMWVVDMIARLAAKQIGARCNAGTGTTGQER